MTLLRRLLTVRRICCQGCGTSLRVVRESVPYRERLCNSCAVWGPRS